MNMNKITDQGKYEMRIDMVDFDGNSAFAKYSDFSIGDETTKFKLTAYGYNGTSGRWSELAKIQIRKIKWIFKSDAFTCFFNMSLMLLNIH